MSCRDADQPSPSSIQASFGFNFGLGAKVAKQISLPPQRPARLTPTLQTPRSATGSAKRHRSASIQRSGSVKRKSTPISRHRSASTQRSSSVGRRSTPSNPHQTPQLGKRKRGPVTEQLHVDEEELDELSPDRDDNVPSGKKSRRHLRALSPTREELYGELDELSIQHEAPDELSMLEDRRAHLQKAIANSSAIHSTPTSSAVNKRMISSNAVQKTPLAHASKVVPGSSRNSIPGPPKSIDAATVTPGIPKSASLEVTLATPTTAPANEDSEDELSPLHANGHIPQTEQQDKFAPDEVKEDEVGAGVDELSSPMPPTSVQATPSVTQISADKQGPIREGSEAEIASLPLKKRRRPGRPRRLVEEEGDESAAASAPTEPLKHVGPKKASQTTSISRKPGKKRSRNAQIVEVAGDKGELSPESDRTRQRLDIFSAAEKDVPELSDAANSDDYEEPDLQELPESAHRLPTKHHSPKRAPHVKPSSEFPSRKRQKLTGPKHAFSVMRIKGSTVRGITVADTARTILEEIINHRLTRMAEQVQTSQDSVRRKELRSCINLTLSFKESLDEKLLDLQDANDVLSTGLKKMKLFKRDNASLRKEILALQNSRQDIALEHDDVQAEFDAERAIVERRSKLSANLYDIEAAVRKGREKARTEGREDEGPRIPLGMMIDNVGRDIGSVGGGLLDHVKGFNDRLERAAGWLEGRA